MSATAALSSATSSMDVIDEHDLSPEDQLSERLASARIEDKSKGNDDNVIHMNSSTESTMDGEDELPTPKGFFIDATQNSKQHEPNQRTPWPLTPPHTSTLVDTRTISSCPRPSSTSKTVAPRHSQRPIFGSSSSGALLPPSMEPREIPTSIGASSSSYERGISFDENNDMMNCPATRAAAAIQALETSNEQIVLSELDSSNKSNSSNNKKSDGEGISSSIGETISRQETLRTSHEHSDNSFNTYPSGANEPIPQHQEEEPDGIPSLYTFSPNTFSGRILTLLSRKFVPRHKQHTHGGSALAGFTALLLVTCANYMLGPMRDAAALAVGVSHIPALTLASTVLALGSSVPVGWLFEAPNPMRRRVWKKMGLTRGETQGTSLALFYRVFAFLLLTYAVGFKIVDKFGKRNGNENGDNDGDNDDANDDSTIALVVTFFLRILARAGIPVSKILSRLEQLASDMLGMQQLVSSIGLHATLELHSAESIPALFFRAFKSVVNKSGKVIYIMFFLVVHLMKLHSLSLIWGVTTEAMEYEENAEMRRASAREKEGLDARNMSGSAGGLGMMGNGNSGGKENNGDGANGNAAKPSKSSLRLKRLGFVAFGGTLGGILGSVIASFAAHILHLSGLLIVAAILLELSANLSVELGRIMQRHWEEQMRCQSFGDLASLASDANLAGQQQSNVDSSMRKSVSLGSMKRVASGSLSSGNLANLVKQQQQQQQLGDNNNGSMTRAKSSISLSSEDRAKETANSANNQQQAEIDDNSFKQRLLRGITTILKSRLLLAIFTYNALYASTSVLLSFQRAELVANRSSSGSSAVSNTAFLAKINTASSVSVFALQASGLGAYIANSCGQRGALALMPIIRLCGVILLGWWHFMSNGKPPDLISFLVIDEFTKVINFAIAKPVRENLWRGLSAEARYEAKPIVDTLANRWGGGSAAFLVSFINRITNLTGHLGVVKEVNGERTIFGFPPVLLLCMIISAWWTAVSADVGNIRKKIDLELKKQQ